MACSVEESNDTSSKYRSVPSAAIPEPLLKRNPLGKVRVLRFAALGSISIRMDGGTLILNLWQRSFSVFKHIKFPVDSKGSSAAKNV